LLLKSLVNLDHQAFQAGVGMLSASGEPLVIDDLTQLQRPVEASRLANQFGFKSVLATPIQRDEATYGIFLALHSSESFTDVQAGLAQGVSSALASAIANARLVNQLEQKANTDALTGLYNARFFSDVLTREVARAERHRVPLTMLMLDVDDFKQINDVYGHPVGNEVLKSLSRILQLAVRMTDFVFRCGGDEFGVVLPDTDVDGGFHVGEHIRRRVETSDLVAGGNSRMTVSVGVSQYELGIGVDALMKRADEALYRAKRGLKNSVEIYRPGSFSEAV
jgi:diguanylate cyclase (GGDEF)-like protein